MFRRMVLLLLLGLLIFPLMPRTAAQQGESRLIPIRGYSPRAVISPDGKWLAVFDWMPIYQIKEVFPTPDDRMVRLVNLETGDVFDLGYSEYFVMSAAFSPGSTQLASSHMDGVIKLWDVNNRTLIREFPTIFNGGNLSYLDETTLLFTNFAHSYPMIDTETGYITGMLRPALDFSSGDFATAFEEIRDDLTGSAAVSSNGSQVVAVTASGKIWLLQVEFGLGAMPNAEARVIYQPSEEEIANSSVRQLGLNMRNFIFLADNRTVTFEKGTGLNILDTETGTLQAVENIGFPIMVSPDGSHIVWLNREDGLVRIAPTTQLETASTLDFELLPVMTGQPQQLLFTPDGNQLILAGFRADDPTNNGIVVIDVSDLE